MMLRSSAGRLSRGQAAWLAMTEVDWNVGRRARVSPFASTLSWLLASLGYVSED